MGVTLNSLGVFHSTAGQSPCVMFLYYMETEMFMADIIHQKGMDLTCGIIKKLQQ